MEVPCKPLLKKENYDKVKFQEKISSLLEIVTEVFRYLLLCMYIDANTFLYCCYSKKVPIEIYLKFMLT